MTNAALIALSALLLLAYLLDVLGRRSRLPSVVMLIATGMAARAVLDQFDLRIRFVDLLLPVIGTVGLVLIVLEGALDLEVRRSRAALIARSGAAALLGFAVTLAGFAFIFQRLLGYDWPLAALAAMPFAVISSAVAIPSATGLETHPREFVVYESSLSDILGVLVFYAWLAAGGSLADFSRELFGGIAISLVIAFLTALALFALINRIEGHVRFVPLLAALLLLYAAGKALHLSPLVLVLICGLLLNNPHLLEWHGRLRSLHRPGYERTLAEFKSLVVELTFAVKSVFFLMLGYWTEVRAMTDWRAWAIAVAFIGIIYASRTAILGLLRVEARNRLVWIAPRGLITVLLFLTAAESGRLAGFPFGAVMLIVILSATLTALAHRGAADADAPAEPATPDDEPAAAAQNE